MFSLLFSKLKAAENGMILKIQGACMKRRKLRSFVHQFQPATRRDHHRQGTAKSLPYVGNSLAEDRIGLMVGGLIASRDHAREASTATDRLTILSCLILGQIAFLPTHAHVKRNL